MVVFSNDTRCAIQQYTSQGGIHIRGDILLQTSCFIDHMLQGFSGLCLQISCAAPDSYPETPSAEGDTDIYPLSSPLVPALPLPVWHFTLIRAGQNIYKGEKMWQTCGRVSVVWVGLQSCVV